MEMQKNLMRSEVILSLLQLPNIIIEGYILAASHAPRQVLEEADPLLFLRLENGANAVQQAAVKLAVYWSKRQTCFGPRAFLSMNQTNGMGALRHEDMEVLKDSCLQRLANDKQGHGVFLVDISKITSSFTLSGTRGLFHRLHLANETGGIVVVFLASGASTTTSPAELDMFFCLLWDLLSETLPLKVIRAIVTSPPLETPSTKIPSLLQVILQKSFADQVFVTLGDTPQELANKLDSFGLVKEGLPPLLGGTCTFAQQPMQPPLVASRVSTTPPEDGSTIVPETSFRSSVAQNARLREASGGASAAAIVPSMKHDDRASRQNTSSKRKSISSGEVPADGDKKMKAAPSASSNTRIASTQDENVDEEEAEQKRIRSRNAYYSRRKYERKKIEIQVRKEEAQRLKAQNSELLYEQQRLEKLVAEAEKLVKNHESAGCRVQLAANAATLSQEDQHKLRASIRAAAAAVAAAPQPFLGQVTTTAGSPHPHVRKLGAALEAIMRYQEAQGEQAPSSTHR